jgi:hypothetical protein
VLPRIIRNVSQRDVYGNTQVTRSIIEHRVYPMVDTRA